MTLEEKYKLYKELKHRFIYTTSLAGDRFKIGLECYLKGIKDTLNKL